MQNIAEVAQKKITSMVEDGTIEKMVSEQVTKTVTGLIQNVFQEYSEFGKSLKEVLNEKMKVNLDNLNIAAYNTIVIKTIEEHLQSTIAENSMDIIKKKMDVVLGIPEKREWKLSDIVRLYWEGEKDADCKPTLEVKDSDYGSIWIFIGRKDTNRYSSYGETTIKIAITEKTGKIWYAGYQGGEPNPLKNKTYTSNLEATIMGLWAYDCKLEIDVRDVDDVEDLYQGDYD